MSRHPALLWAQRSDKIYITIELPDAKDVKLNLNPDGRFHFSANTYIGDMKIPYEIDITLYGKVVVNESKFMIGARNIRYLVRKASNKWWSRLVREEGKPPVFIRVDWNRWIDEDDEKDNKFNDEVEFSGMESMNFSKLNMGGNEDVDAANGDGGDATMKAVKRGESSHSS